MFFFFFNDTATTEIYTLSLHDALPICHPSAGAVSAGDESAGVISAGDVQVEITPADSRSEEHTSELQSLRHLVCRLLLRKKNASASTIRTSCLRLSINPTANHPLSRPT